MVKPVSKSSTPCGGWLPTYGLVKLYELLFYGCGADKPTIYRVVDDRLVRTPAVGVAVLVPSDAEGFSNGFESEGYA